MILSLSKDSIDVIRDQDVVYVKNRVKETSVKIKMGLVNQTRIITAASEILRNMIRYANGGKCIIEVVSSGRNTAFALLLQIKVRAYLILIRR